MCPVRPPKCCITSGSLKQGDTYTHTCILVRCLVCIRQCVSFCLVTTCPLVGRGEVQERVGIRFLSRNWPESYMGTCLAGVICRHLWTIYISSYVSVCVSVEEKLGETILVLMLSLFLSLSRRVLVIQLWKNYIGSHTVSVSLSFTHSFIGTTLQKLYCSHAVFISLFHTGSQWYNFEKNYRFSCFLCFSLFHTQFQWYTLFHITSFKFTASCTCIVVSPIHSLQEFDSLQKRCVDCNLKFVQYFWYSVLSTLLFQYVCGEWKLQCERRQGYCI